MHSVTKPRQHICIFGHHSTLYTFCIVVVHIIIIILYPRVYTS